MDAGIQLKNMTMKENETLGEYLARARTLFKAKLKLDMQWDEEYDPSDMWYIVNGLTLTHLKNRISKKLNTYKSYKQCFDHIKEEWQKTHYLDGEYTSQTSSEVNKIQEWEETTDDPQEQAFQAEVNEVFQKYGTTTTTNHATIAQMATDPSITDSTQTETADSQATTSTHPDTKAQQWPTRHTTFNGTTTHPNVSYAPGTLNMGPMHQQWGYQNQPYYNQYGNKQQTPAFNKSRRSKHKPPQRCGTSAKPPNSHRPPQTAPSD